MIFLQNGAVGIVGFCSVLAAKFNLEATKKDLKNIQQLYSENACRSADVVLQRWIDSSSNKRRLGFKR